VIRSEYKQRFAEAGDAKSRLVRYGVPVRTWTDLYKVDPSILRSARTAFDDLRRLLVANDLLFVAPDELAPIGSGRRFDEEYMSLVLNYGLDSSDALILMETQRLGISSIVTFDQDLLRAQADFTIYTWL
jgi:hypothetical protein